MVDDGTVAEPAVLTCEVERHLEVGQRDDRLDVVLQQLVEQVVIKLEPCLVRLRIVPVREDPAPTDRRAETLQAHLSEERDVFFITVIEVDCFMIRIKFVRLDLVRDPTRDAVSACCQDVDDARSFAVGVPAAFKLVGG